MTILKNSRIHRLHLAAYVHEELSALYPSITYDSDRRKNRIVGCRYHNHALLIFPIDFHCSINSQQWEDLCTNYRYREVFCHSASGIWAFEPAITLFSDSRAIHCTTKAHALPFSQLVFTWRCHEQSLVNGNDLESINWRWTQSGRNCSRSQCSWTFIYRLLFFHVKYDHNDARIWAKKNLKKNWQREKQRKGLDRCSG